MASIKDILVPAPGYDLILAADYSQLEVLVVAQLAGPGRLRDDLRAGVDVHTALLAMRKRMDYNELKQIIDDPTHPEHEYWVSERKTSKRMSFQLQYGAGAKSMAMKLNLPVRVTKEFIDTYYKRYPEVKRLQQTWMEVVKQRAKPSTRRTPNGHPAKVSWLESKTGRRYVFYETDNPPELVKRFGPVGFNPPNIKNYPVQGLATGDIVPIAVANLHDRILDEGIYERLALCNTVHDSIVAYTTTDFVDGAVKLVKEEMESVTKHMFIHYGMELFKVPVVEVEVGPNMAQMKRAA